MEQLIGVGCFATLGLMCMIFAERKPQAKRIKIEFIESESFMVPVKKKETN